MVTSRQREIYRLMRYDYYHAGRVLHLMGNFHGSGIMLGYTVETTMKTGLMEVMPETSWGDRILRSSHDVVAIWNKCRSLDLFGDVKVSMDFLKHINNNFRRYPSEMWKILAQAQKSNVMLGNSIDWLYYYDDLVVQLDDYLFRKTGDLSISMIHHAIRTLEVGVTRDILRKNAFALLKFDEYASRVRQNMPERDDLRNQIEANLSRGSTYYWNTDLPVAVSREKIANVANTYSASKFQLPKWQITNGHVEGIIP